MAAPKKPFSIRDIKTDGEFLVLPKGMAIKKAIEVLALAEQYNEEPVVITETIPVFVWDGALALQQALVEQFGMALQEQTEFEFFGQKVKIPPTQQTIEVALDRTGVVPWGQFMLPGVDGTISTGVNRQRGQRWAFTLTAKIKHKDEEKIYRLIARVREIALANSIYRSQAISMRFRDENSDEISMPTPHFLRLSEAPVIFSLPLQHDIERNILTLVRHPEKVRCGGTPLKRGIVLAGPYGTGKTLTANWIAREAIQHGWTFIYVTEIRELPDALRFAQGFQPAIVFAEDIERLAGIERTDEVNQLLNILDGIGNKRDEIMTILTSNHPESINEAMRRPGRIDVPIYIEPPDAEAASRMLLHYASTLLTDHEGLDEAGKILAGSIPAIIREAAESAKLEAIRRTNGAQTEISGYDIAAAAESILRARKAFSCVPPVPGDPFASLMEHIGGIMRSELNSSHVDGDGRIRNNG